MPGGSKPGGGLKVTPYKMKNAPVNMRAPGSVAKMAGVSPMKNKDAIKNLAAVDPKLRDEAYYKKVKEITGSDKVKSGGKIY